MNRPILYPALAVVLLWCSQRALSGPALRMPNDPLFRLQTSFWDPARSSPASRQVTPDVLGAWLLTTGSRSVVVAVLDDGFFYQHEDLRDNIWHNPGESGLDAQGHPKETNGIDDDGNGYVDDVVGWDFAFHDPDPDAYVFDGMDRDRIQPFFHGTAALGIIGARADNAVGIAGVNWDVSMMLLKIGAQGIARGDTDAHRAQRAAQAIHYAVDNGARVINWSGFVETTADRDVAELQQAFTYAEQRGVLIVLSAGNSAQDLDDPANAVNPQSFPHSNIIRVAEVAADASLVRRSGSNQTGGSNYGAHTVEIAAIAANYTTDVKNGLSSYQVCGGTSCAAPVVTGVAALVLAVRPDLRADAVKRILLDSATPVAGLKDRIVSGGVVNAQRAVSYALRWTR